MLEQSAAYTHEPASRQRGHVLLEVLHEYAPEVVSEPLVERVAQELPEGARRRGPRRKRRTRILRKRAGKLSVPAHALDQRDELHVLRADAAQESVNLASVTPVERVHHRERVELASRALQEFESLQHPRMACASARVAPQGIVQMRRPVRHPAGNR